MKKYLKKNYKNKLWNEVYEMIVKKKVKFKGFIKFFWDEGQNLPFFWE